MPTPIVTRQHLEKAWLEVTGAATTHAPVNWNSELVRSFVREVPTVASVILAAGQKRFQSRDRAAVAEWVAAWLHRAYKLAGATFSPLTKDELIALLQAEQEHLVRASRLTPDQVAAAEFTHLSEIPNGHLVERLMDLWGRACFQRMKQGEDPKLAAQDAYHARLHLAVTLLALNRSAKRTGE